MIRIKNARLMSGELASLTIAEAHFQEIKVQGTYHPHEAGDQTLRQWAEETYATPPASPSRQPRSVDAAAALLVPAAVDVHVHSRDPGYPEKEDWQSLAQAAYKGGVVALVDMPNTLPPTMFREQVLEKAKRARASGLGFRLMLGLGQENIAEIAALLQDQSLPLAGLKVYYGQSTGQLMYADLERLAQALPRPMRGVLVFHSEDQCRIDEQTERLSGELSHDTKPETYRIHSRIRDSASAWQSTQVILDWAKKWQQPIHLAHVSTPRELEMIERARLEGLAITCEVAPHHLLLSSEDYADLGGFLKVNPPVRSAAEVALLRQYWRQGKIDCFATDHAPHTRAEKLRPYQECPAGLPALEYFWPLLVSCGQVAQAPWPSYVESATLRPAQLFGFPRLGAIRTGFSASFVCLLEQKHRVQAEDIKAKCGWSPYQGKELAVQVQATWHNGKCVYLARN